MAERISNISGHLTFADGRVPDNDTVPQSPAEPAPPVTFGERLLAVILFGIVVGAIVGQVLR